MRIRVLLRKAPNPAEQRFRNVAFALAALLTPAAVLAFTISCWSVAADLHWTANFFVTSGLFSHWQVWLISAAALFLAARLLNRYAERQESLAR